jgi:hypothetical protein
MLRAMADELTPAPKKYGFKPKEFERVNALHPTGDAAPPSPPENDVFALRQGLREREKAAGFDLLTPPDRPRPNRRRRDYWFVMLTTNGVLIPLAIWGLTTKNAALFVYALAGVVLISLAVSWLLWVVLDRY